MNQRHRTITKEIEHFDKVRIQTYLVLKMWQKGIEKNIKMVKQKQKWKSIKQQEMSEKSSMTKNQKWKDTTY